MNTNFSSGLMIRAENIARDGVLLEQRQDSRTSRIHTRVPFVGNVLKRFAAVVVAAAAVSFMAGTARCAPCGVPPRTPQRGIPTSLAVRAIIGEAGGESFTTQLAVACALRNRGTLQGVYGVDNPVVAKASHRTFLRAQRAWAQSAHVRTVGKCRFFGCDADRPILLSYGLKPVCRSGAITFYN